jgi:hypothetical protein
VELLALSPLMAHTDYIFLKRQFLSHSDIEENHGIRSVWPFRFPMLDPVSCSGRICSGVPGIWSKFEQAESIDLGRSHVLLQEKKLLALR